MERTHKSWGDKCNIFQNDSAEVSILKLKPKQRCSWHRHQAKFNLFYVMEGEVIIKTDEGQARVLKGQSFTTRPGEWHEFRTANIPAKMVEVMYVQYNPDDIERQELGGPINDEQKG